MRKVFASLLSVLMIGACLTLGTAAANEPVNEIEVPYKEASIDGVIDGDEWDGATALTLNITDTQTWTADGAGLVGDVDAAKKLTDDDFTVTIKLMYKDGYLYYLETRKDTTPYYSALNFRHAYTQDGTLTWFYNNDTAEDPDVVSVFAKNDNSKNDYYDQGAFMVYGVQNSQEDASTLACEEIKSVITNNGYVIEAKIDISKIALTERDLALGHVNFTFCTVNIFNTAFVAETDQLWTGYGFQAQYTGVNTWAEAPVIKLVGGTYDTSLPETDAPVTVAPSTKPATTKPVTEPATNAPTTNAETKAPTTESNNTGLIIGIVAVVAVVAVVVVVIVVKKKKQ